MPAYHRLDVGVNRTRVKEWGETVLSFSIYNVYNKRNPFSIYFRQQEIRPAEGSPVQTEAVRLSVIGNFIPSVAYNFKF